MIDVPAFLDPFRDPLSWDTVEIAGIEVGPRVGMIRAEVDEGDRGYEWDRKKGKGASGETSTFVQKPAADVSIVFTIWGSSGVAVWYSLVPALRYDPIKGSSEALPIFHPALVANDINTIVVDKIGKLTHEGGGKWRATIKAHEYAPPPPLSAVSTPVGAANDPNAIPGVPTDPAVVSAQKEFDAALGDAKAMGSP